MITEFENICVCCGKPKTDIHHLVFGRGLKELADADKLTAPLCRDCHRELHETGIGGHLSKIIGQLEFEAQLMDKGLPRAIARENFRKRYGRSYL